jgi:cobalt-zinc-cadmium efflux system membrane fusion protein
MPSHIDRRPILPPTRRVLLICASIGLALLAPGCHRAATAPPSADPGTPGSGAAAPAAKALDLSPEQRNAVRIEPAGTFAFVAESETVGTVSFDEDPAVIQAESTLISAAASLDQSRKELRRAQSLGESNGIAPKELEGAIAARETAAAALKAARDAVRALGKTDAEIDRMVATGQFDSPGTQGHTVWVVANVTETDSAQVRVRQRVRVQVAAHPNRSYAGRVSRVYSTIDPNTHRLTVRAQVEDPKGELRPGMLATVVIRSGEPVESIAVPTTAVVREGDGSMITWVTSDRQRFTERSLTLGLQREGRYQVLAGLKANELVVVDGGVFLSNLLEAPPSD